MWLDGDMKYKPQIMSLTKNMRYTLFCFNTKDNGYGVSIYYMALEHMLNNLRGILRETIKTLFNDMPLELIV